MPRDKGGRLLLPGDLIRLESTIGEQPTCILPSEGNKTMRVSRIQLISACMLLALPGLAIAGPKKTTSKVHSHASVKHASTKSGKKSRSTAHHMPAAVAMPAERATQIQTALIKQGYLTGEPTGTWDAQSISAMQKLQADNGWQSKVTPDSRALIKLGLGPETPGGTDASNTIATTQTQK